MQEYQKNIKNKLLAEQEMIIRNASVNCVHDNIYVDRPDETSKKCLLLR